MNEQQTEEYIELLENNLVLMQQRHDLMHRVQEHYGTYKADVFLKSIGKIERLIDGNNQKIRSLKIASTSSKREN